MLTARHYLRSFLVLLAVLLTGCAANAQPTADQPAQAQAPEMSREAKAHLDEVLDLMQKNSINRLTIDWKEFREKVYAPAAGAKTIEETRPAIGEALRLLGDRHSIYRPKTGSPISYGKCTTVITNYAAIPTPLIPDTVGYIRVDGFSGTNQQAADFTESIQQAIKSSDGRGVTRWIVDLRRNTGGNMWPMLAGLSPILGEGPLGYFVDPTGTKLFWEIRDGVVYYQGRAISQAREPYRLKNEPERVAVLTDAMTASSGEAVVIAFRGVAGARSFGSPTCGLSTANRGLPLRDGGTLILTVSVMADRTGTPYGGPVVPDEVIDDAAALVERALAWLVAGH